MAEGERFLEKNQIVWVTAPANYNGTAATTEYVSLKNWNKVTFIINTGAWAGGTAAVTVNEATSVSAGSAQALTFTKYFTNDGAPTSPLLTETSCSSTFNLDTANSVYAIEITADMLTRASDYDCVSCAIASPASNNDYYSVIAILSEPRYAAAPASQPSSVVD